MSRKWKTNKWGGLERDEIERMTNKQFVGWMRRQDRKVFEESYRKAIVAMGAEEDPKRLAWGLFKQGWETAQRVYGMHMWLEAMELCRCSCHEENLEKRQQCPASKRRGNNQESK